MNIGDGWRDALGVLKRQITMMPRAPYGECECCRNHAVDVHLILTAENFNRLREALFSFPDTQTGTQAKR